MATLYKRGNSYYLNWSEGGEQFRKSLGSIGDQDAQEILELKQSELKHGFRIEQPQESITFGAFCRDFASWHETEFPDSHFRVSQIISDHLQEFRSVQLVNISRNRVEKWKAKRLKQGATPGTVGKELRTLKSILNKAVAWKVITGHDIDKEIKEPRDTKDRPPPYYTADELGAIYEAATQYGALWRFLANTGLRRAEIMKARRRDIVGGVLMVLSEPGARTKSTKWRQIPLSPSAKDALDNLPTDYLAPRINPRSLSRAFEKDAKRGGCDGSIHWLRHTFCSHLVMNGVGLRTVQELAGHASYQTTLRYSHLSASHLSDAVSNLTI